MTETQERFSDLPGVTQPANYRARIWTQTCALLLTLLPSVRGASVEFSSVAQSCLTLCDPMNCSTPGLPCPSPTPEVHSNSRPSSRWCHQAISSSCLLLLPLIPPSIRVFSNESSLHIRWLKYWSFSFSISPSKEHPGLISFRMDWLDLLTVQGTLMSLL